MKLNEKRLVETFLKLAQTDSESYDERAMQELVEKELKEIGCRVTVDNAGKKYNTNAKGNVIAFLPGTVKSAPFVLCSHLDTVTPGKGVNPVVKKDCITSDGTTVLGGDDKAGVAIILEILRTLKEQSPAHPPVEAVFTLSEEVGMFGSKNLDYKKLKGREGLILDNEEVDTLLIQGPAVNTIEVWIKGLAAHAGVAPEKGISALEVASYALGQMKLGRIDKDTVANFGVVKGGSATNVVMPELYLKGEARSLVNEKLAKQTAHMKACFDKAVKRFTKKINGKTCKPEVKFAAQERYPAVRVDKKHPVVKSAVAAAKKAGVALKPIACGGGCDANVLAGKGFTLPNVGVGVRDCHTTKEKLILKEFFAAFHIVLETLLSYKK
ncbi:MAG: M20/M25/M40 family metallo-hydrolase [Candidatus Avelusimicrobium sp.]|uniref:M20/M25/M40 family metallo-hydrolase n=1 Tax=Candidatus Avelusimicrobium sp. TaxID=3048833 RepID=UPI003F081117